MKNNQGLLANDVSALLFGSVEAIYGLIIFFAGSSSISKVMGIILTINCFRFVASKHFSGVMHIITSPIIYIYSLYLKNLDNCLGLNELGFILFLPIAMIYVLTVIDFIYITNPESSKRKVAVFVLAFSIIVSHLIWMGIKNNL